MSLEELRDFLRQVKEESGRNIRVIVGKHRDDAPSALERNLLQGVETTESSSIEAVEARRQQRQGRMSNG
jgi:hypothetical protein